MVRCMPLEHPESALGQPTQSVLGHVRSSGLNFRFLLSFVEPDSSIAIHPSSRPPPGSFAALTQLFRPRPGSGWDQFGFSWGRPGPGRAPSPGRAVARPGVGVRWPNYGTGRGGRGGTRGRRPVTPSALDPSPPASSPRASRSPWLGALPAQRPVRSPQPRAPVETGATSDSGCEFIGGQPPNRSSLTAARSCLPTARGC